MATKCTTLSNWKNPAFLLQDTSRNNKCHSWVGCEFTIKKLHIPTPTRLPWNFPGAAHLLMLKSPIGRYPRLVLRKLPFGVPTSHDFNLSDKLPRAWWPRRMRNCRIWFCDVEGISLLSSAEWLWFYGSDVPSKLLDAKRHIEGLLIQKQRGYLLVT